MKLDAAWADRFGRDVKLDADRLVLRPNLDHVVDDAAGLNRHFLARKHVSGLACRHGHPRRGDDVDHSRILEELEADVELDAGTLEGLEQVKDRALNRAGGGILNRIQKSLGAEG